MSPPAPVPTAAAAEHGGDWSPGVRTALVGLAYFALARLGLSFATITGSISPVWPPSGLALGALLLGGLRLWPGVACGALAAAVSAGAGAGAAVLMATGNTLEAVVTVVLLRRWLDFQDDFTAPRQVVGYILLHGGVGAPLSAAFGTLAAHLDGQFAGSTQALAAALTWWGGNFTGGLVVGPLLIGVNQMRQRVRPPGLKGELAGLLLALVVVSGTVFVWGLPGVGTPPALLVLPFPLLIWIAWRFAIGGAALSLVIVSGLVVWGSAHGAGPFTGDSVSANYAYLLTYLVVAALTALVLAAFNLQREQALARLRQREWQLSEAQRIANLGVWVWDLRTDVFSLSEGSRRILGLGREEAPRVEVFLGRLPAEDRLALEELLRRARLSDRCETCEIRVQPEGQPLRHVSAACLAVRDVRGEPVELLGTLFDFSERKRYEEEQVAVQRKLLESQKLESLGLLAGGIAHDFNNLLTGILGNASLLRLQLPEGSGMSEGLRRIESSAERAADLCRQMLAYSGKGRFVVRTLELNETVHGTLALAQSSVPKRAQLGFDPAPSPVHVRADMLQFRQVLLNLVLNAAEALPETGGHVKVRTGTMALDRDWLAGAYLAPELPAGDYAFVEVTDTGCGIAPELHTKIFDPFFSTKFTGRGLGLAAVAGVVRAHRGAVRVDSTPGSGAVFRVVLPATPAERAPAVAAPLPKMPEPARAAAPRPAGAATWLVVDDEAAVRQVATDALRRAGLAVEPATDGVEALELFGADGQGFAAVLLDFSMPRLDGLETFKRLRARRADIPVVLMSGFDAEEALERFAGLGITGFLQKPFTLRSLSETVAKVGGR